MPPTQCQVQAEPAATAAQQPHTLVPSPPRHTKQISYYQQVQTQVLPNSFDLEHQSWHLFGPCKSLRLREEVGKWHEEHQGQIREKKN